MTGNDEFLRKHLHFPFIFVTIGTKQEEVCMPYHIAIVEDEQEYVATLREYLSRFAAENGLQFQVSAFTNAITFLENYKGNYTIVLMDIRMPYMNGMTAARRLRELDTDVGLIFITSLSQYAISGYEVDALDYILKPVKYYDFALKFSHALDKLGCEGASTIAVSSELGVTKLTLTSIRYIESDGHFAVFHTTDGKTYRQYITMTKLEETLRAQGFSRSNSCYLVNLRYVISIKGYTAYLDQGDTLRISQPRKKQFQQEFTEYCNQLNP